MDSGNDTVLEIDNLTLSFKTDRGPAHVLDGVSLSVARGQTLGLVGESGCGKSVTGMAVMGLLPEKAVDITGGYIRLGGESLLGMSEGEMRALRGKRLAMIFQDPMTSLNPLMTIGAQLAETLRLHRADGSMKERVEGALASVGIGDPARAAKCYPHQFSGGMRQRAMIAMMLACRPEVLLADEPTTALDVTVQAQVLDLIRDLQGESGMAVVLVTHNLGVVAEACDVVAVMYAGTVVERATTERLFAAPQHPYTQALLDAIPRADQEADNLAVIEGRVPDLVDPPIGCRFHPRCPRASDLCRSNKPMPVELSSGHEAACHYPGAPS